MIPALVSARGTRMPRILYGTAWKGERTAGLVEQALRLGFRGVDTACQPKHYDEAGVGVGVAACLGRGLGREELYLQTKFTPLSGQDPKRVPYAVKASLPQQVRQSCGVSLENLGTSYLDALLLHSPLESVERTLTAWRELEALVDEGAVRELGVSNCYDARVLQELWNRTRIKPWIVQNRFYDKTGYDAAIRALCQKWGLVYQSFWTLSANPHILAHESVADLARRYRVKPAQVLFRCLTQLGVVPLTGTTNLAHMQDALRLFEFELRESELSEVQALLS